MVKFKAQALDATFAALADPTRRAILARLALGETSVGELAEPFDMSLPAVSKHLGVLEGAGLLARERDGRVRRCRLQPRPLQGAAEWIAQYRRFWEEQFDALARYLELEIEEKKEREPWPPAKPSARRPSASGARSRRGETGSSGRGRTPRS
jgi:DNA-binding transcriptional ArsR family regulator